MSAATWATSGPHRPPVEGEQLLSCVTCGRVEVPLNNEEEWHYVRTGEGLVTNCPRYKAGQWRKCKWKPLSVEP